MRSAVRQITHVFIVIAILLVINICGPILLAYLQVDGVVARHRQLRMMMLTPADFSKEQLAILFAVEDPRFFDHHGLVWSSESGAGNTITGKLVELLYAKGPKRRRISRTTSRALALDAKVDKRTQLTMYLNSAYFGMHEGREIFGFHDAARIYFDARPAQLTREQYVSLVAMLADPNAYSVASRPDENATRVARIERLLRGECKPRDTKDVDLVGCASSQ